MEWLVACALVYWLVESVLPAGDGLVALQELGVAETYIPLAQARRAVGVSPAAALCLVAVKKDGCCPSSSSVLHPVAVLLSFLTRMHTSRCSSRRLLRRPFALLPCT